MPNKVVIIIIRRDKVGCSKQHREKFVQCDEGVIYSFPSDCGKNCIGQKGRCLNGRLREHKNLLGKTVVSGHLAAHCKDCACVPLFGECSVIAREKDRHTREVIEALEIDRPDENGVRMPSVALSEKEKLS